MACANKNPYQPWVEHYNDSWPRGTGAQTKTLTLKFDGGVEHVDGSMWKIARLMPINYYTDIKVRTAGMPGVKIDLGCVGHSKNCKGEFENIALDHFAKELDLKDKLCGTLDCGPWDCRAGCAPECCTVSESDCADPVHISEPHDLILTLHGEPKACDVLHITFSYTNSN